MTQDPFDIQIEFFRKKILDVLKTSNVETFIKIEDVDDVQVSVSAMLKELQIASEELVEQNDALARAQVMIEQESLHFQDLFESAPDAYVVTDLSGVIQQANQAALTLLNIPPTQVSGKPMANFARGEALKEMLYRLRILSTKKQRDVWEMSLNPRRLPAIEVLISAAVQNNQPDGSQRVLWLIRDMTAHKRIERRLYESHAQFRAIFDAADIGIAVIDLGGRMIEANLAFQRLFNYQLRYLQPLVYPMLSDNTNNIEESHLFTALAAGSSERYTIDRPVRAKSGQRIWVRITMTLLRDSNSKPQFALGLFEDITLQLQRDEEIIRLERHLEESAEKERESLARDLHDGPLQQQIAVLFRLQQVINDQTDPTVVEALERIRTDVQQVVNMLRMTTGLLRSPTLAHFGLDRALTAFADQIMTSHPHIEVIAEIQHPDWNLTPRVELGIYRIVQHLITNATRHAETTQVIVRLFLSDNVLVLEVQDNGKGFVVPKRWIELTQNRHYGLLGSAERAASLGGILQIRSRVGEGTTVRVVIPLDEQEQKKQSLTDLSPEIITF